MSRQRKLAASVLLTIAALLIPDRAISAEEVLTNASDILALSPDRASNRIDISITGIVTAAEPNWAGRFFVQDASGGVFVNYVEGKAPVPGDLVAVTGVSMPGGY